MARLDKSTYNTISNHLQSALLAIDDNAVLAKEEVEYSLKVLKRNQGEAA